jgi:hypothetical protein
MGQQGRPGMLEPPHPAPPLQDLAFREPRPRRRVGRPGVPVRPACERFAMPGGTHPDPGSVPEDGPFGETQASGRGPDPCRAWRCRRVRRTAGATVAARTRAARIPAARRDLNSEMKRLRHAEGGAFALGDPQTRYRALSVPQCGRSWLRHLHLPRGRPLAPMSQTGTSWYNWDRESADAASHPMRMRGRLALTTSSTLAHSPARRSSSRPGNTCMCSSVLLW